jgi:hypothetical protein
VMCVFDFGCNDVDLHIGCQLHYCPKPKTRLCACLSLDLDLTGQSSILDLSFYRDLCRRFGARSFYG